MNDSLNYRMFGKEMYSMPNHNWNSTIHAQMVKNLLAEQETWVQSLGWEDPLEKGSGYLLRYSCLKNLMESGAWRAVVRGASERHDSN